MKRFLETLKHPMTIGATVGTALFIFFVSLQGPARCRDGWASPSIGTQGACSQHGGVASSPLLFELMLSALVGWAAGALRNRPVERAPISRTSGRARTHRRGTQGKSSGGRDSLPALRISIASTACVSRQK
jgi:hypothetical protein